jgi:hypothetical protein
MLSLAAWALAIGLAGVFFALRERKEKRARRAEAQPAIRLSL